MNEWENKIKRIPWRTLQTSYGRAAEIPDWLMQLTSTDPAVRQNALERLSDEIIHQGSIVEATPYVVPLLIEMLSFPSPQGREEILALLWKIASGYPLITEEQEKLLHPTLAKEGRDFNQEVARAKSATERSQAEIRKGLPAYLHLLDRESTQVKIYLALLLSVLSLDTWPILARLKTHLPSEPDSDAKAALLWVMGRLLESSPEISPENKILFSDFFHSFITTEESILVRYSASVSQLIVAGNDAEPEAVNLLIDAVSHPEKYPPIPWFDHLLWTGCEALANLQGEKRIAAFQQVFANAVDAKDVLDIVTILLNHLFIGKAARLWQFGVGYDLAPNGTKVWRYDVNFTFRVVEKLTQEQRTILEMIARYDRFWETPNTYFAIYGLPASREELARFLNK